GPRIPIFDVKITPFDPTGITHAQSKRSETRVRFGIIFGDPKQNANASQSFGLLRAQCERPCRRCTNKGDEVAPPHMPPRQKTALRSIRGSTFNQSPSVT